MRADVPRVVSLCKRHHAEQREIGNPNFSFAFDAARVSVTVANALSHKHWLCRIGEGDVLLLAHVYDDPFGAPRAAIERVIRGDLNSLVPIFEEWARAQGCERAVLSTTHRHAAFERLYRRFGYALAETVYSKAL